LPRSGAPCTATAARHLQQGKCYAKAKSAGNLRELEGDRECQFVREVLKVKNVNRSLTVAKRASYRFAGTEWTHS